MMKRGIPNRGNIQRLGRGEGGGDGGGKEGKGQGRGERHTQTNKDSDIGIKKVRKLPWTQYQDRESIRIQVNE